MNHIEPQAYTDFQYRQVEELGAWHAMIDIYNAILYGFIHCRLPQPGRTVDVAEAYIASIEREWEAESLRRDITHLWSGPPLSPICL